MGQVYQATDTKLNRQVALKILPEAFASDQDRLARFQREAQVLASLNHPNIAAIHGLEESDGQRALVLELVEGPTLADRIKQEPIPVDEALPIAKQIAEALEAAHEAGVIHRDLKPANIKVRDDGTVKVLDFGLAKALDPTPEGDPSQSPTLTAAATQMGVIMGTAAYMSPEQAAGKAVNKRSDIWSFGVVLYEMLTGERPFTGETVSHVLGAVLQVEPDWDPLPTPSHVVLGKLLKRCLVKEPRHRLRDIGDTLAELDEALAAPKADDAESPFIRQPAWQRVAPVAIAVSISIGLVAWVLTLPSTVTPTTTRLSAMLPQGASVNRSFQSRIALSPDGTRLAYAGSDQLYLRHLNQLEAVPVSETAGAIEPFFSSNGEWVGFWADGELKKVPVTGGLPVVIAETARPFGVTWNADDTILFGAGGGTGAVWQVAATGGSPEAIVPSAGAITGILRPQYLPEGDRLLFSVIQSRRVLIHSLVTGERQTVVEDGGGDARYLPTGHLAYVDNGTLLAVPFDASQGAVTGAAVPVIEGIEQGDPGRVAQYAFADSGSLVYERRRSADALSLVWVNREGEEREFPLPSANYNWPRVSPDGTKLAVTIDDELTDVWISDVGRGTPFKLTTHPELDNVPHWTPDGEHVVFASAREANGLLSLFRRRADGTGPVEKLLTTEVPGNLKPYGWSPDGKSLLFDYGPLTNLDIGVLNTDDGSWEPLLDSDAIEAAPTLSPNGEWVAYTSDQTGRLEIYVQRFPGLGDRRLVSSGGGVQALWSPGGDELFYRDRGRGSCPPAFSGNRTLSYVRRRSCSRERHTTIHGSGVETTMSLRTATSSSWSSGAAPSMTKPRSLSSRIGSRNSNVSSP